MDYTAAQLAVYALEQLGIDCTLGIPGVHNTELYDELDSAAQITPYLVVHEQGAAFMADAYSRMRWGGPQAQGAARAIGTLAIVPAAGLTHAASGLGEAFLAGVPMLVLTGGIRTDTRYRYKLHEVDQLEVARGFTKAAFRVETHAQVVPTLFAAYRLATTGLPGPVLVEIPVNLQVMTAPLSAPLPVWQAPELPAPPDAQALERAADLLLGARQVGLFVGWGARGARAQVQALADFLQAPVSTTLQGLGVFPATHALHTGFGFSRAAVPASRNAFAACDAMLAVGTRFAEIPTASFSARPPATLVHVDQDARVFGANYPTTLGLEGDAQVVLSALLEVLQGRAKPKAHNSALQAQIARDKAAYTQEWLAHASGSRVNPAHFFQALRAQAAADSVTVLDDGNHTFLTAELYPQGEGATVLTPSDFNAMGYAVPAAIGAKLADPTREVLAIVGDGCFAMTCMELMTAVANRLGLVVFVFKDGALSQIAQAQHLPYQRSTCTRLPPQLDLQGVAQATGAAYVALPDNASAQTAIARARALAAQGQPVIVDVAIDYSKATAFTQGTTKANFASFPLRTKLRFLKRIMLRKWQQRRA